MHLWDDVNSIFVVLSEVSAEFDGEDALRAVMRGVLEKARYEISLMHEFLSGAESVQVTMPSEDAMQLARTYFDKGIDVYQQS